MRFFSSPVVALVASISLVSAHMEMTWPPPLRSKHNSFTTNVDYDMVNPLNADGSNYPCKGYLNLLGTQAGAPVTTFRAGETYTMKVGGGANHAGGSCQASLSFDGGKTFTVIKSFLGGCPPPGSSSWDFQVPVDTPSKTDALFAWTWFNRIGNREMYMNCAVVTTEAAGSGISKRVSMPFSRRPGIFVANVANGCATTEGSDVQFPDPGPEVDRLGGQFAPPVGGSCGRATNNGGGSSDSGGSNNGGNSNNGGSNNGGSNNGGDSSNGSSNNGGNSSNPGGSGNPGGNGSGNTMPPSPPSPPNPPAEATSAALPGGIFMPRPTTTMATVTRPAATPSPDSEGGDRSPPIHPFRGPCREEGLWNCLIDRFQRCASGQWSVVQHMAAGTECRPPGLSYDFHVIAAPAHWW